MAPITLPVVFIAILVVLTVIGYVVLIIFVIDMLKAYFNKLHAYVIKKGWL